jgi:predicted deacetylase
MLRELGVARASLLVVPRWHGATPCNEDREFADWLRARVAEGHEVCLHAFVHEAAEVTGNAVQRAMGKHYTAGEGEFYQIGEADAAERLREGLRIVRDGCGVPVWGFTAPAWLAERRRARGAGETGFGYTTRWGRVELLQSGECVPAPVLVWSTRAAWRRICSRGWVRLGGAWIPALVRAARGGAPGGFFASLDRALGALGACAFAARPLGGMLSRPAAGGDAAAGRWSVSGRNVGRRFSPPWRSYAGSRMSAVLQRETRRPPFPEMRAVVWSATARRAHRAP